MHDLSTIFDQQDLFTSKLFDGFLFMKYEEFYQDIYNNNISQDNHTEVFTQVTSFPQRPDFGHQPSRDRDKLYSISMRQVSNIWKSFNATLSDSNPSHAPQSRVSVIETDFVNGRNMFN